MITSQPIEQMEDPKGGDMKEQVALPECTEENRSCLALITFCAINALVATLGFAILVASCSVARAVVQSLK